jgi:PiT family inorganic phosphate transporter
VFFFVVAFTIGREVVTTLSSDLVSGDVFTLRRSIGVLLFIGIALFVGNYFGVPASTSMTAVGSIAGLGAASGTLAYDVLGRIAIWWIVAPIIGFWVSGVIGRYLYPAINRRVALEQSEGPLFTVDRSGTVPRIELGPNTTRKEGIGTVVLISIGCLMAFSSGTSNIANAIAPLVGNDPTTAAMNRWIILGSIAVAIGAFTIARRTLDTLGGDITELPLTASIIVAVISSAIVTVLSWLGIPASFVIIATMSIVGLGWGRATRTTTVSEVRRGEESPQVSVGALAADEEGEEVPSMGEENPEDIPAASNLFDPSTTGRVIIMQNLVPIISTVGAYLTFRFVPLFGL